MSTVAHEPKGKRRLVTELELGDLIYRDYDWREIVGFNDHGEWVAVTYRLTTRIRTFEWTPVEKGKRVISRKKLPT